MALVHHRLDRRHDLGQQLVAGDADPSEEADLHGGHLGVIVPVKQRDGLPAQRLLHVSLDKDDLDSLYTVHHLHLLMELGVHDVRGLLLDRPRLGGGVEVTARHAERHGQHPGRDIHRETLG